VSGGLALLQAFCSWKIELQVSTVLSFSFFSCNHRRSQGGHAPSKFLAYLVILCFDRQCLEQNTVAHLNSKYLVPLKVFALAGYATARNHLHSDGLYLSPAQPCFSISSLSHSTFLLGVPALSYLVFSHPLTKVHNTARPPNTPELRWKAVLSFSYCVANNITVL